MIVQDLGDRIRCIDQHDHALLSGVFAGFWRDPQSGERASSELITATALHDMCWIAADKTPRFNPDSGRPYDFLSYPEGAKLSLYLDGIQAMEALHPWGALLHALHFSSFASPAHHPEFHAKISALIERYTQRCHREGWPLDDVEAELKRLRLFDVFSLLLCMTGPEIERPAPPWLEDSPLLRAQGIQAYWEEGDFVMTPFYFTQPFDVSIVYRDVDTRVDGSVDYQALVNAGRFARRIRVRPPHDAARSEHP